MMGVFLLWQYLDPGHGLREDAKIHCKVHAMQCINQCILTRASLFSLYNPRIAVYKTVYFYLAPGAGDPYG